MKYTRTAHVCDQNLALARMHVAGILDHVFGGQLEPMLSLLSELSDSTVDKLADLVKSPKCDAVSVLMTVGLLAGVSVFIEELIENEELKRQG